MRPEFASTDGFDVEEPCTATIQVGGQTVTCFLHEGEHEVHQLPVHRGGPSHLTIEWDDEAPSATPHRDPEPTFEPVALPAGAWGVMLGQEVVAYFAKVSGHPDAEGAAVAEAERLNGKSEGRILTDLVRHAEAEADLCRKALEHVARYGPHNWANYAKRVLREVAS